MAITSEQRREKGRENRERIAAERRAKQEGTYEMLRKEDLIPGPRMPRSQREMQQHLSGRYEHVFRGPETREERRWWHNWWTLKGRGFTKPERIGERIKK